MKSGAIGARDLAKAMEVQKALSKAGVRKSLVEILESDAPPAETLAAAPGDRRAPPERGGDREPDKDPLIGRRLGGFLLEKKLGEGGMGAVYRATQTSLGRPVALKVLAPAHAADPEFVARFIREARAAARLNHPHVVQPLEIGDDDGCHFFAMEFCDGGSVASRIRARGAFPERDALGVVKAVGLALAYAGELGMIHRDVKPDNILFTRTGIPKLADLGLAKESADEQHLTMTGMILGTPCYMSPEQALGKKDLDIRSDVYALGITLYEMLTGVVPFKGDSALAVLHRQINDPLPDPREVAPGVSSATVDLLNRMTAKEKEARHETAGELVAECDRVLQGLAAEKDLTLPGLPPSPGGGDALSPGLPGARSASVDLDAPTLAGAKPVPTASRNALVEAETLAMPPKPKGPAVTAPAPSGKRPPREPAAPPLGVARGGGEAATSPAPPPRRREPGADAHEASPPRPRHTKGIILGVLALLAVFAAGVLFGWQPGSRVGSRPAGRKPPHGTSAGHSTKGSSGASAASSSSGPASPSVTADMKAQKAVEAMNSMLDNGDFDTATASFAAFHRISAFSRYIGAEANRRKLDSLEARIELEPDVDACFKGALVAGLGGGRYRVTYSFAPGGTALSALEAADPKCWLVDGAGLGFKGAMTEIPTSTPAVLRLPFAPLGAIIAWIAPIHASKGFLGLFVGGRDGKGLHVRVEPHRQSPAVAVALGPLASQELKPDDTFVFPAKPGDPYALRIDFFPRHGLPGAPPELEAHLEVSGNPIGTVDVMKAIDGPANRRLGLRMGPCVRLRRLTIEGTPAWSALRKKPR